MGCSTLETQTVESTSPTFLIPKCFHLAFSCPLRYFPFYSAFPAARWQHKRLNIDFIDVFLFGMGMLQALAVAGLLEWPTRGVWHIARMYSS